MNAISHAWCAPRLLDPDELLAEIVACMPPVVSRPRKGRCPKCLLDGDCKEEDVYPPNGGTRAKTRKAVAKRKTAVARGTAVAGDKRNRLDIGTRLNYADLAARLEARRGGGDPAMAEIASRQGFDARPRQVTAQEFEQARRDGGTEVWRGFSGEPGRTPQESIDQFFNGPAQFNPGLYGSGYSGTSDRERLDQHGIPRENQVRLLLPRGTRVIDLAVLAEQTDQQAKTTKQQQRKLFANLDAANGQTARETALRALQDWTARQPARTKVFSDPGRFAAALGFQAIRVPAKNGEPDRYVVLDRGSVLAQRDTVTAGAALRECEREIEAYDRGQERDPDGKWGDGIPGPQTGPGDGDRDRPRQDSEDERAPGELERLYAYTQEDYDSDFGDMYDEFEIMDGEGYVRIFDDGTAHVVNEFESEKDGQMYQPLTLLLNSEQLSEMEDALDEAMSIDIEDYEDDDGEVEEDDFGAVDSFDGGGLRFAPYGNGDIQVRIPRPLADWEEDQSEQHAWDLSEEQARDFKSKLFAAFRSQREREAELEEDEDEDGGGGAGS